MGGRGRGKTVPQVATPLKVKGPSLHSPLLGKSGFCAVPHSLTPCSHQVRSSFISHPLQWPQSEGCLFPAGA